MVCMVTGSSRGLGKAAAIECGARGHQVVVHYREDKSGAETAASHIRRSLVIRADIRKKKEVKALVAETLRTWDRIDVLINNAGITHEGLLLKTTDQAFDNVMDTNLKGPFTLMQSVGRQMMKQKGGHVINVSSYAGMKGREGLSAYAASKAALIGLTKTAARELSRYNIMVNAVLPGYMMTDMGTRSSESARSSALDSSILRQYSDPDAVAAFICRLAETRGITGQVFNLDSRIL